MVDTDELKKIFTILLLVFCLGYIIYAVVRQSGELERDGFTVIEEHETYKIVEKEGHQYVATPSGMYSMHWSFEHYPNCPCRKEETP